ncbi:DUF1127 domain-containing protein [Pseudomonas sp. TTU2014-080ASC]|uniref:DUF1127 domain-containing protein n=1 Tax=Pseudomonas sp. TTU2014-080ASC TaxID=1729724 RepID=UPI0007188137|nr:DUF1127 domain-containing protein [Pseudomonas sp. TTU2014-080ASC]KRW60866.1 hypothetical protein AO726_05850 [Pseudomonas sp. TTU2014-080ASC]
MERTLSSDLFFDHGHNNGSSALSLRIFSAIVQWRRRAISRRQLAHLDARLLADAGITEAQRQAELSKPFWR